MMFPSRRAMYISSVLGKRFHHLVNELTEIQYCTIEQSANEVQYFENLFPKTVELLDNMTIEDLHIRCQSKQIHRRPIVRYGRNKRCELGDYFVNVKYYDEGKLLGRKLVVYQFKMEKRRGGSTQASASMRSMKRKWKIDQKQLTLLCEWPTFLFGNAAHGHNSFTLAPRSPDLGSYWLAQRDTLYPGLFMYPYFHGYDIVAPAISIRVQQEKQAISVKKRFPNCYGHLCGACALALQIMWRYGELIETGTPAHDFLDALYRFVELSPDPPGEFNSFSTESEDKRGFWGLEIHVGRKPQGVQ